MSHRIVADQPESVADPDPSQHAVTIAIDDSLPPDVAATGISITGIVTVIVSVWAVIPAMVAAVVRSRETEGQASS